MITKTMTLATGFAVAGLERGVDAAGGFAAAYRVRGTAGAVGAWRQVTGSPTLADKPAQLQALTQLQALAQLQAIAAIPAVKPAALPNATKRQTVATTGAGHGNRGTSPWGFPV